MTVIVTQHDALVSYLQKIGMTNGDEEIIEHAFQEDIKDRDVIGILPLHLAVLANTVTTVPLNIPPDMRNQELTLEDIEELAGDIQTFKVELTDTPFFQE